MSPGMKIFGDFFMKVKFLIIRFSSIGDIILTSPVIRCLKHQVENAEIHFVTKKRYECILCSNPYIEKVHGYDDNMNVLLERFEKEKFDYIIDLHLNLKSNRIKRSLKIPSFAFNKLGWKKMFFVRFKIDRLPRVHVVYRYLDTVYALGVKNDGKGLDYFIPNDESFREQDLPAPFRNGYVAFVIAGTYFTKKLPLEKVSEVCQKINFPVILLGGKAEFDEGEKVLSQSKGNVLNYAGKISLNESASLIRNARVVLTNDTGLMHIAAAFKKKILSFWGNTVPLFGMTPYETHPESALMEIEGLRCRPCSKLGHKKCPKKHFKCMNEIKVDNIVNWIDKHY